MLSDHGTSCCKPSASCLEAKCLFSLIFCLLQMRCVLHQSCRLVCDRRKNDAQVLRSGQYPEWILGEKVARVLMFLVTWTSVPSPSPPCLLAPTGRSWHPQWWRPRKRFPVQIVAPTWTLAMSEHSRDGMMLSRKHQETCDVHIGVS